MPYEIDIKDARQQFPHFTFVKALTPSEQKAAFHVKDKEGVDYCLKFISPAFEVDRLRREIEAMQTLDHPNVVKFIEYTFSSTKGSLQHYLIEEYVNGADLAETLTVVQWKQNRLTTFFVHLFDGLDSIGSKRIVHRDLKPQNIRVRPDGTPVIIDFGLARLLDLPDITNTAQGARIGTPSYYAPEQFEGTKNDIDVRTDLFAAGELMYCAAVGRHPFYMDCMTYRELRTAVCLSTEYLNDPHFLALAKPLRLLISKLLKHDRSSRPHNAKQVKEILVRIGADT